MPSKNDLSLFKPGATSVPEQPVEPKKPNKPVKQVKPAESKSILSPRKPGRKPKPAAEKETEIVALKLTPSELAVLEEKAGLAPKSTFLKHILRTKTDVFE